MRLFSKNDDVFSLTKMLRSKEKEMKIPIILGIDSDNNIIIKDLQKLGNILMGGQTGSGKSIFIHSIICSLLLRFSLKDCKFILIDPKRVELTIYNNFSHVYRPVIVNPDKALVNLELLVQETNKRLENKIIHPYLIIIIDTFSDLFFTNPDKFEKAICYIASHSKETNIFVLISDSRVSSEIYTDKILSSFQAKVAFATANKEGSRCLIGIPDASDLQGNGDMLFLLPENAKPLHLQGINVLDQTIQRVIDYCVK